MTDTSSHSRSGKLPPIYINASRIKSVFAADKMDPVNFDVCALIAGAFYIRIMSLDMAFWHTAILLIDEPEATNIRLKIWLTAITCCA
jgi:hypothetical protein